MKVPLSASLLFILIVGMLIFTPIIKPVKSDVWIETIYIREDGSIEPLGAPVSTVDYVTYTLTDNIVCVGPDYSSVIIIERNNTVLDGAGYTLKGTGTYHGGIEFYNRSNIIIKNTELKEFYFGVGFMHSHNITVWGNNITNSYCGVITIYSSFNSIIENNITNNGVDNGFGIWLLDSPKNNITGNYIVDNDRGIGIGSSNNLIYNNSFIDNIDHVYTSGTENNIWDDGYPSGGNFWSNYTGIDSYNGPYQNQSGSDGIWDHPYIIDENNRDNFPLVDPWAQAPVDQPPNCVIQLQNDGIEIDEVDVGLVPGFFDIYVGGSTDDTGIAHVRFSVDEDQDGDATEEWTEWFNWIISSGDWDATTKKMRWSFDTLGKREIWAEVKDEDNQTDGCSANIHAVATHASGFDPEVDGFSFPNWRLMTENELRDFRNEIQLYIEGIFSFPPKLGNLFYHYTAAMGHCYGMATTSIIYYKDHESKPVQKDTFDMSKEEASLDIARNHAKLASALGALIKRELEGMNLEEEYEKIAYNLGRDQPVVMLLKPDGFGGRHAVVVFKAKEVSEDIKYVWVYDNEIPGTAIKFIFDLSNNQVSQTGYGILNAIYIEAPNPPYWQTKQNANDFIMTSWTSTPVFANCPVNITIIDEFNRSISEMSNEIPGATFESSNLTDTKIFWLPSNLTYTVHMYATDYGNVTIGRMSPSDSYVVAFSEVFFNLTSETVAQFELVPLNPNYTCEVDEDGDGTVDYGVAPEIETINLEYDIGITQIVPSTTGIGQGSDLLVNVTIMNYGAYLESFNVTLYANETSVASQIINLSSGNSTISTFLWNTVDVTKSNYTLSAYIDTIIGETDLYDNNFTGCWVVVTLPGDIDGDRDVDIFDIVAIAGAYGSEAGDPEYNLNYDIDGDGDIDIFDIVAAATHYGESW